MRWYNVEYRYSGINYVTSVQRHAGEGHAILAARHRLYSQARDNHLARGFGHFGNWSPTGAVTLNPERDAIVVAYMAADQQPLAV